MYTPISKYKLTRNRNDGEDLKLFRQQILDLHNQQWSASDIARHFNKNHTTILYHLKVIGVKGIGAGKRLSHKIHVPIISSLRNPPKIPEYFKEDKINEGKLSYSNSNYFEDKRYLELLAKGGYVPNKNVIIN
jgi:hypothetical protein